VSIKDLLLGSLAVFLLLTPAASRQLTAIRVADGGDLQKAINTARPGQTILLAAGARFAGNFVLPAIAGAETFITIRTDGATLPREGVRTGPEYAGQLAVIQSPNNEAALRTAPGAHHWRLENLEFRANADGNGNIIELGSDSQRTREDAGRALVLDRLLITGDSEAGQKRAIALNSGDTEIRNCYIAGIRGVGMDTQAIAGWAGPGPYLIENNYLEAAGENLMFGGNDPAIPDLVPEGITIRRNVLSKPESWRDPIVSPPAGLKGTASSAGGTLAGGTYIYSVVSEKPSGQGIAAVSRSSTPVTVSLDSTTTGSVALEWSPVKGATAYRVYRSGEGGSLMWRSAAARFTDTGTGGTSGTPPERATVWTVKNLFELKNARNVVFEGNLLERNWLAAQAGYAILMQPANSNRTAPWTTVENVRIANNIVRHVAGAVNILGIDQKRDSRHARRITIANNLFDDVSRERWGGRGDFLLIGGGAQEIVVERNTVFHTGRVIAAYGGAKAPKYMERFVFRNNLLRHNEYGVKGDGVSTGQATLEKYFPGAVFEGNVLAGGNRTLYPRGNHFPSLTEFEALFFGGGNYRLRPGAAVQGVGADIAAIEAATGLSTIGRASKATLRENRD
jgi:hypothetical protein